MNKELKNIKRKAVVITLGVLLLLTVTNIAVADAPDIPNLSGPTTGKIGEVYEFTANTTDIDGDYISFNFSFGEGNYSDWTVPYVLSGEDVSVGFAWENPGTYDVTVKAKDAYGHMSDWSGPLTITIENDPPDAPNIYGPSSGIIGTLYTFTVETTDPNDQDISYFIDWGDGTNSSWIQPEVSSGTPVNDVHFWTTTGTYYIRTKAKDCLDLESSWSTPFLIDITNDRPTKPTLAGPESGVTDTAYEFSFVTTDPEGDDISYFVDWGDGNNTGWIVPDVNSGETQTASHSWTTLGYFTVKVQAKDEYGAVSAWSDPLTIHIGNLEIVSITGGFGVTAQIKNVGEISKDIDWNISAVGGTIPGFHFNQHQEGRIEPLDPGEKASFSTGPIFGLGRFKIEVIAECAGEPIAKKTVDGLILFFYVIMI